MTARKAALKRNPTRKIEGIMNSSRISKVAVLGDGAWGTALALTLHGNGREVTIWGPFPENIAAINANGENKFLKGVRIPSGVKAESDIAKAISGAELIVLASTSQYMRNTLNIMKPHIDLEKQPVVNVAKGIELGSLDRMSQLCEDVLGKCHYASLSGPSHAEEVALKIPTAVVVASHEPPLAKTVQEAFMSETFRVYTSSDLIGVELGGALKNVYAIATGMIDGMQLGDNPKAALMTRGIAEMTRLGLALGGESQTFAGLSGIGDLIVTCMSKHSRNRYVGEELGKGRSIDDITKSMGMVVAEGVKTSESAHELAERIGVDAPIISTVLRIIRGDMTPKNAVFELMTRKAKHENE